MAINKASHGGSVIIISIVFAMVLTLLPISDFLRFVRPEWVLMVLIYWAMALPNRVGIGIAWLVGLLMDMMLGGALGVLALAYALVIYVILRFHLQIRQYPLWQQAFSLLLFISLVNIIVVLMTPVTMGLNVWLPAIISTLLWPVMYIFLRAVRRGFHVY